MGFCTSRTKLRGCEGRSIIDDCLMKTCGCNLKSGIEPGSGHFSQKTITQTTSNCHQMSELDFTIMPQLSTLRINVHDVPSDTIEKGFRPTTKYLVHGLSI